MQNASYEKRDFGLDDIRNMVRVMYAKRLSCSWNIKLDPDHGIIMNTTGHNGSGVHCNPYECIGCLIRDYIVVKAKEHRCV